MLQVLHVFDVLQVFDVLEVLRVGLGGLVVAARGRTGLGGVGRSHSAVAATQVSASSSSLPTSHRVMSACSTDALSAPSRWRSPIATESC